MLQYDIKLGNVGDIHVGLVGKKLVLGIDGEEDLSVLIKKLHAAHQSGVIGTLLAVAEKGIELLPPAPAAEVAANP